MVKINVPKELLGSVIVLTGHRVRIESEVSRSDYEIIKAHYPQVSEVVIKPPKKEVEE